MSNKNLTLQVTFSAMDKLSTPIKAICQGSQRLAKQIQGSSVEIKKMKEQLKKIDGFNKLNSELKASQNDLVKAREKVSILAEEMKKIKTPTEEMKRKFSKAKESAARLRDTLEKKRKVLHLERNALKSAGINTSKLKTEEIRLNDAIKKTNQSIETQKNKLKSLQNIQNKVSNLKKQFNKSVELGGNIALTGVATKTVGRTILNPTVKMGEGVIGMAKTAGKFEQFQSILEVTEGSSEKAKESLEWVKKFAVDTPSNLDEAMEAFVRLRAYGMDPTNGLLKTLGDTSAAMGKPVMQAVEAIADAVTGENERLKEFGIKGRAVGKNIIEYEYTDKNGQQQIARVNKNNRQQIEKTLSKIFNDKYAGAMEKQAKTLMGIWSKIEDHWTNLQVDIMSSGAFDWIKNKLQGILDTLDNMQANGELKKWAEDIGTVIQEVAQGLWAFGEMLFSGIKTVATFTRENKGIIAQTIKWSAVLGSLLVALGPVLFSLALFLPLIKAIGIAIFATGKMMLTNPIIAAIMLIIAAGYLLWKNWDKVIAALVAGWQWLKTACSEVWDSIKNIVFHVWDSIVEFLGGIWEHIKEAFNGGIGGVSKLIIDWSPIGLFYKAFSAVLNYFGVELPASFSDVGSLLMEKLSSGIVNALGKVKDTISNVGSSVWGWFKEKIGIDTDTKATFTTQTTTNHVPPVNKWSGGYAGNGGKYQPMGVFHGGEYIMTKEATSRLGVPLLNALNYGKKAMLTAGMGLSVATAQPFVMDNRPPLSPTTHHLQETPQPMQVTINIHATAGQRAEDIAREVEKALVKIEQQKQARMRSSLRDRD
ncbi:tape measure protein [Histophilus somni]|uniref:tape measure protein n=1 Tax=Histophilus somni TaxID=731 RepID=UPI00201F7282|nr:tape measure protein [Histophilus somni]